MSSPYDANFHKITRLEELAMDTPRPFRAGGTTILLRRDRQGVSALDGSCLIEDSVLSPEQRVSRILKCIAFEAGLTSMDWESLHAKAGLDVKVEDGEVWVCVNDCE